MRGALLAASLLAVPAFADGTGMLDAGGMRVSAKAVPRIEPVLALVAPPVADWSRSGFATPIELRMRSSYLSAIDRWQLAIYRAGDEARARPVALFRGSAAELHEPVSWDGRVADGPALRPGERVLAVLSVRDPAGNVDETAPQSILVNRYLMPREEKERRAERDARLAAFRSGSPATERRMPLPQAGLRFEAGREASGRALRIGGLPLGEGRGAQALPPGEYRLLVETEVPLLRGTRRVPLGTLPLRIGGPAALRARVSGSATLSRLADAAPVDAPAGLIHDGSVRGEDALSLALADRTPDPAARLALALLDPEREVPIWRDEAQRRHLSVARTAETALWNGAGTGQGAGTAARPDSRELAAVYKAAPHAELVLPETDILTGTLRVQLVSEGLTVADLLAGLHFFAEFAEGRIAMTLAGRRLIADTVADNARHGREAEIVVRYAVPALEPGAAQPRPRLVEGNGGHLRLSNGAAAGLAVAGAQAKEPREGWLARLRRWVLGG